MERELLKLLQNSEVGVKHQISAAFSFGLHCVQRKQI